jgi:hypothetical protein
VRCSVVTPHLPCGDSCRARRIVSDWHRRRSRCRSERLATARSSETIGRRHCVRNRPPAVVPFPRSPKEWEREWPRGRRGEGRRRRRRGATAHRPSARCGHGARRGVGRSRPVSGVRGAPSQAGGAESERVARPMGPLVRRERAARAADREGAAGDAAVALLPARRCEAGDRGDDADDPTRTRAPRTRRAKSCGGAWPPWRPKPSGSRRAGACSGAAPCGSRRGGRGRRASHPAGICAPSSRHGARVAARGAAAEPHVRHRVRRSPCRVAGRRAGDIPGGTYRLTTVRCGHRGEDTGRRAARRSGPAREPRGRTCRR